MSGHNKWSQIKHKKAKEDAKRGKAFTKLIKEIAVAAREGGGDPAANSRLRMLIEKAKEINMPSENTIRAIKRGTGELPGVHYTSFLYEGYGPFGIAVIVDTLSDNKNRTVADLRRIFSANGGNLAEAGAVNWLFEHLGVVRGSSDTLTEDELLEALLDFDIKDIRNDGTFFSVFCDPKSLDQVKQAVKQLGLNVESAEFEWVPKNTVQLTNDQSEKALAFLSALHDHDDVQNVYANLA
jgi:YebC/PmpR family DNA-binding regulatory protein